MKITTAEDKRAHIFGPQSNVWSVIREIVETNNQEDAFYICDMGDIVRKQKMWVTKLPRVKPYYAVKCNDALSVLEVLNALNVNFDCASRAEINKVLSMGVHPDRIIFANPAKPSSHIRHAAAVGVDTMTFDCETELHKIKKLHPNARMVLRIRSDATDAQCQLGFKFGCDPITEAPEILRLAKILNINVIGVSFHVGSGCREIVAYRRAIAASRKIFDFAKTLGYEFSLLDIGGGYPGEREAPLDKIAEIINEALCDFFPDPNIDVIAEPGRYYVSSAYTLACNIHSIRNVIRQEPDTGDVITHRMYYINDGVYGSFNCILFDDQIVIPLPLKEYSDSKYYSSSIWGPTCDSFDRVIEDVRLPDMKIGDWIVFEDMGAYTLPVASQFNGFPIPKVHIVMDEDIWDLIKDICLHDEHFEMLTAPQDFDNLRAKLSIRESELPTFPISIEIPYKNGEIEKNVLDFVEEVNDEQL